MSYWALGLTSLALTAPVKSPIRDIATVTQTSIVPIVPGFEVSAEGFRARSSISDWFKFERPIAFKLSSKTPEHAWYRSGQFAGNPQAFHVNRRAPGFELLSYYGLGFKLSCLGGPNLTVEGATYGPGTPTPQSKWVLVTFGDAQPPVLLTFLEGTGALEVKGRSGEWRLQTTSPYKGWIRISTPFGIQPQSASGVATLGELAKRIVETQSVWIQPGPNLISTETTVGPNWVEVRQTFDRAGAVVPPVFALAKLAGYPLKSISRLKDLRAYTEQGPMTICLDDALVVRFPCRQLPPGRGVAVGSPLAHSVPATTQPNLVNATEGALVNLSASRSLAWRVWSESALDEYLARAVYQKLPSGQQVPFELDGTSVDLAAAMATLEESLRHGAPLTERRGKLLEKVLTQFDPFLWKLQAHDQVVTRRSTALASLSAWINGSPSNLGVAAMLHAGMLGENALSAFLVSKGLQPAPSTPCDPLAGFRSAIFMPARQDPYLTSLLSPLRVGSHQTVSARMLPLGYGISWAKGSPGDNLLSFAADVKYKVKTVKSVRAIALNTFEHAGPTDPVLELLANGDSPKLPPWSAAPKYSE